MGSRVETRISLRIEFVSICNDWERHNSLFRTVCRFKYSSFIIFQCLSVNYWEDYFISVHRYARFHINPNGFFNVIWFIEFSRT